VIDAQIFGPLPGAADGLGGAGLAGAGCAGVRQGERGMADLGVGFSLTRRGLDGLGLGRGRRGEGVGSPG